MLFFSLTPWKLGKLQKAKRNFYSLLFYAWDCWQILIISIRIIHIFIFFVVCNYFLIIFVLYFNFISARTLINTLLLTHSRTKPAVPWLHTVGSTTNNRGNLFLKVHSVQKRRGCVLAQVSLIFLVRPSSHSSIAHLFILEKFVPISLI